MSAGACGTHNLPTQSPHTISPNAKALIDLPSTQTPIPPLFPAGAAPRIRSRALLPRCVSTYVGRSSYPGSANTVKLHRSITSSPRARAPAEWNGDGRDGGEGLRWGATRRYWAGGGGDCPNAATPGDLWRGSVVPATMWHGKSAPEYSGTNLSRPPKAIVHQPAAAAVPARTSPKQVSPADQVAAHPHRCRNR
eukprot:scaffold18527_cov90-Isochrysis_galbana.AAC.1